jgi:hypothetical protein
VLAPSGDPFAPTVLLDRNDGGRWCEEVAIEQSDDEVRFRFDDWGGALTFGQVQRTRVLAFRHVAGALTERFGFAPKIEYFVEDWLAAPWSLAQQATAKDAPSYVEARHDALGAAGATIAKAISSNDAPSLSYELFPTGRETQRKFVIYCALSDSGARCPDWPKPVDFLLEQTDGLWRVRDVTPRK